MLATTALVAILIGLTLYTVMDGAQLGAGVLTLMERDDELRDQMSRRAAFHWDAAESWILLPAVGLLAALPKAYAAILPAAYLPVFCMLFAFIARGVAIEFLHEKHRFARGPGRVFGIGSLVAVLAQGAIAGALLRGPRTGAFGWLSWYAVLCALAALALQLLSGAAWLYLKGDTGLRERAARWTALAVPAVLVLLALCWITLPDNATRLASGGARSAVLVAAAVLGVAGLVLAAVFRAGPGWVPFTAVAVLKVAGVVGVTALVFPAVVPGSLTLYEAASSDSSLGFFLGGVALLLPVALIYNAFAYGVFSARFNPLWPTEPRPAEEVAE
ncbi:cytochrome d ubiquinol oxidase subunit II [Streptomyces sp. NPDC051554]|uniref:cytochrome d ubiquinol oxidase subunit II n=1 Tax=Streptomyces sp. NPDC051554 TaxID=3365656 RepID=UPI0037AA65F8